MPSPLRFAEDPGIGTPGDDLHPALHPSVTNVPVTPAIESAEVRTYSDIPGQGGQIAAQPQWNSNSYYAPREDEKPPSSPTEYASGAKTPAELLRRLSLVDSNRPVMPDMDLRALHPNLNLSGGIISATFCIPHSLGFQSGRDWVSVVSHFLSYWRLSFERMLNLVVVLLLCSMLFHIWRVRIPLGIIH